MSENELVNLLSQLVSCPSWVDDNCNESALADFVADWLAKKEFKGLKIRRQEFFKGRNNLVITTPGRVDLVFTGHLDTVSADGSWLCDPLTLNRSGKKITGLGVYDMKGGVAAILTALTSVISPRGVAVVLYGDEEYNFAGMKAFLKANRWQPKLVVSAEPTDLKVWQEHRGLIEFNIEVSGPGGHAAKGNGANVINVLLTAVNEVSRQLTDAPYSAAKLMTTVNVASILGGTKLADGSVVATANKVPNYAEATVELRPAAKIVTAALVKKMITKALIGSGVKLKSWQGQHDLGPLLNVVSKIDTLKTAIRANKLKVNLLNAQGKGYSDLQLLAQSWRVPAVHFGPRGGNAHTAGEWVDETSLKKCAIVYQTLIEHYSV